MAKTSVVIPNFNGEDRLRACLGAAINQTPAVDIIVVDNGSTDGSKKLVEQKYPDVILIENLKNLGFAGGVNTGIRYSLAKKYDYIALLNNDAVPETDWLSHLVDFLDKHGQAGIVTSKILDAKSGHIDSTGESYSVWGLPYPRGRGERDSGQYDEDIWVFGASGGASLYRAKMLEEIGLFDEDFFAYYEDVDISFRAQLAGWKVGFEPLARVTHQIGATSSKIKGLTATKTLQNLPLLFWKNVPWPLIPKIWPRLVIAYALIAGRILLSGQIAPFIAGIFWGTVLWPKKLLQRAQIQKSRKVTPNYINSIITHDLPPNARRLRAFRARLWAWRGKRG